MNWQPIETAPKDGTPIVAYGDRSMCIVFWNGHSWDDGDFHDDNDWMTHWMPLPEPPK